MRKIDLSQPTTQAMTLLIYGPPGVGKSTTCSMLAAAAEARKLKATLIDAEHGLIPSAKAVGLKTTELLSASSTGSSGEVMQELQAMIAKPQGLVVVDTITEISGSILNDLAGASGQVQIQMYGEQKNRLSRIVRSMRDAAGAGTVAIATAQQDAQDIEGLPGNWHPAVRKALVTDLVSQFDCVARLRQVAAHESEALGLPEGVRYLDFRPSPSQVAKCRTAAELFPDTDSRWHLWPLRNEEDTTRLFAALIRRTSGKAEK
tara:strand:- start:58 stop:840 length:783 start_codon:yes stop_codon:yes gene_type:complete